jgi:uncharacterized membrane protein YgcG
VKFFRGEEQPLEIYNVKDYRGRCPGEMEDGAYFVPVDNGDEVYFRIEGAYQALEVSGQSQGPNRGNDPFYFGTDDPTADIKVTNDAGTIYYAKFYLIVANSMEEEGEGTFVMVDEMDDGVVVVADEEEDGGILESIVDSVSNFFGSIFGGKEEEKETTPEQQSGESTPDNNDKPAETPEPATVSANVAEKSDYQADSYTPPDPPAAQPDPTPAPAAPDPTPDPTPSYSAPDPTPSSDSGSSWGGGSSDSGSSWSSSSFDSGSSGGGGGDW